MAALRLAAGGLSAVLFLLSQLVVAPKLLSVDVVHTEPLERP